MIAVDTNILVYAHREDSQWHDAAYSRIVNLTEGRAPWAIPWPCIHEFLAIVTHPKIVVFILYKVHIISNVKWFATRCGQTQAVFTFFSHFDIRR